MREKSEVEAESLSILGGFQFEMKYDGVVDLRCRAGGTVGMGFKLITVCVKVGVWGHVAL